MILCARCGREVEAGENGPAICEHCAAQQRIEANGAPPRSAMRTLWGSPTLILIALNILVYLAMAVAGRSFFTLDLRILDLGANGGQWTCDGQWWRLLSSTFEHGNLLHIALNLWCLFNLGWLAELLFGRSRYTLLYLLCGIGGSLASIACRQSVVSVGASGAIFGVAGALIPAMLLHSNRQLRALLKSHLISVLFFVVYNIVIGASSPRIDNAAHIGGLLTGLLLGTIFPTGIERRGVRGWMRVAMGTALALVIFAFAGALAYRRNLPFIETERAERARRAGDQKAALVHAQHAVALRADNVRAQFLLGNLLLNAGRGGEAIAPFTAVTRLEPGFGPAFVNLCEAEREAGRMQEALRHCEQGVQKMPGVPDSWFDLGEVRYLLHDRRGAMEAMARAVALAPAGFDENFQYGMLLIEGGRSSEAIPYLQKAHDLRPGDALAGRILQEAQQSVSTPVR